MITRIRIHNYRSLVNFEISPKKGSLFLGVNGTGKSNVFRIFRAIQDLVCRKQRVGEVFSLSDCNKDLRDLQHTFEIDVEGYNGKFEYVLSVEHDERGKKARISYERLAHSGQTLIEYSAGDASLFRDDGSRGPEYPFDWSLSLLGAIIPRVENKKLTWFQNFLKSFLIVNLAPTHIQAETQKEDELPDRFFSNFPSWYRHHSQDQGFTVEVINDLRKVLPGFDSFRFEVFGEETRKLKVLWNSNDRIVEFFFEDLSEGQKALIVLYSLVIFASRPKGNPVSLFIDEPDNYLSLGEIQPWLNRLTESADEKDFQYFIVSHHPEIMNFLMAKPVGFLFEKSLDLVSRVRSIGLLKETNLPFSENFVRGTLEFEK